MEFLKKYIDVLAYLFFGGCTTLINVAAYWVMTCIFQYSNIPSTIVAWIVAVFFAYLTNRRWVFHSEATGRTAILKETAMFYICRIATGFVDLGSMWFFVDVLKLNGVVMKFMTNILVIVLNFIASKMIIFKRNKVRKSGSC